MHAVRGHLLSSCESALKLDAYVNLKKVGRNVLLAICDCEVLGKTLREGKIVFHVKDEFYNGGKVSVEEAVGMIENSTIVNLVGKNCVEKAIAKGYVHPEAVLHIEGIPHAQIVKL
ncbi:MAG: DUF424 family protein [Crenarchaeota archaeon]|nr:DUF424 family protein [Thermoproteota archaeon]